MSTPPRVSVLLPIYNGGKYLDAALASLAAQTFRDFEVLAIDDHSTDDSSAIVQAWVGKDARFRLLTNTGPSGLPHGLNFGLQQAVGTYVARMDQDDLSRPTRLAQQVAFLDQHPKIMLVGTGYMPFGPDRSGQAIHHPRRATDLAWFCLTNTRFAHPSVMFRRSVVEAVGPYPIQEAEDFGFFSKVVQKFPTANLPDVLLDYREHGGNMSTVRREKIAHGVAETYRRNFSAYGLPTDATEMFYRFHAGRIVRLSDVLLVSRISWNILQSIRHAYHRPWYNPEWLRTMVMVKGLILRALIRSFLHLQPVVSQLPV